MASTDARPIPKKNVAYRITFPILDADGDLVTGATGLDSEVSIDGGTFTDCTNEATEIATASGMYYLDLTLTEMNGDTIAIIVKTSSSGAKTTPIVLYPEEAGDIRVDVTMLSGDATAADNAESFFDGTGYAGTNNVIPLVTTTTTATTATNVTTVNGLAANVITATSIATDAITAAKIAADAIGASELASDAVTEIQSGLSTLTAATVRSAVGLASANLDTQLAAVQADTDDIQTRLPAALVSGRIDASVGAMAANVVTASAIAADAIGASELAADAVTEIQSGLATAANIAALNNLSQANVRTAVGLATANLDTQLDALPTNAELATALGAADDATLAAIASLNNLSAAQVNTEVDTALADYDGPTHAELTAELAAADDATLAAIAALTIPTAAANATAVWANGTRTLTSGGGGGGGATAEEIWEYASRTLTQTAAQVIAAVTGSNLAIVRGTTFAATLTGLSVQVTWTKIYLTAKRSVGAIDADALIQIVESNPGAGADGLLRLNGAAATAAQASLTVSQGAGTVAISISDNATAPLLQGSYQYDLKAIMADGTSELLTTGLLSITYTPTEAIA